MANQSFETLKAELDEAGVFLRQFTLGSRDSTPQNGVAAIKRVSDLCDRLKRDFASGPHARAAKMATTVAEGKIDAAEGRLSVLKSKH